MNKKKNLSPSITPTQSISVQNKVRMYFVSTDPFIKSQSQPILLTVALDSRNHSVTGYDIILSYDEKKATFKQARTLNSQFSVYPSVQTNKILLTGIKNIDVKTRTAIANSPIVEFEFSAKTTEPIPFKILYNPADKKSSTVIDDRSKNILAEGDEITFSSAQTIHLNKDQSVQIGDDVVIRLTNVQIPDSKCRDCITSATMVGSKNNQTVTKEFSFGGFAGLMHDQATFFGKTVKVTNIGENGVDIIYTK